MSATNRVVLVGRLTRDPSLKQLPSDVSLCEFSLALNSREKAGGEWRDRVDFVDVTAFAELADTCGAHLAKGRLVAVDGRLRQERWQTQDGANRSRVKVVAGNVQFLDRPERAGDFSPPADDEIPF